MMTLLRGGALIVAALASALLSGARPELVEWARPELVEWAQRTAPPNILIVQADDLGYGDLSAYGQARFQTPSLDRLAREGTRFTQYYAGSTVCAPSRTALMTGLHTGHAYIRGNGDIPLRDRDVTVAMSLRDAGYRTAVIGKWGLGGPGTSGQPDRKGFDYSFGFLDHRHAHRQFTDHLWRNGERVPTDANLDYVNDLFTRETAAFIERSDPRPFFIYLNYTVPHAELRPPADSLDPLKGRFPETPFVNEKADATVTGPDNVSLGYRSQPAPHAAFVAMITRMDRDIGRLMDLVRSKGIDRQTLITFISDNGPHQEGGGDPQFFKSSGGLRGIKRDLYEGGIRVPMIARWTGTIPADRVSNHVWAHWDIFPTVADVAGAKVPEGLDGMSMARPLRGEAQPTHDFLYWEFHERGFQQAVRMGRWKAVRLKVGAPLELYDLQDDPREQHDVAGTHGDVVGKIETYLKTARTDSERWPVSTAQSPSAQAAPRLPSQPLTFGAFVGRFTPDGTFSMQAQGWPPLKGTWKADGRAIELLASGGPGGPGDCAKDGKYTLSVDGRRVNFTAVSDDCKLRRMLLDHSSWRPQGEPESLPERRIVRTAAEHPPALPSAAAASGSWPSFRGPQASGIAEGQNLPDRWDVKAGENIRWRTPVPGLAHSSPVVWGQRIFVTSAISSKPNATFRPGLYGDGDASDDRSQHRWMLYAFDKSTGKMLWERVAYEGPPVDKRHIKSTYASATPATDGRIVVASFGSQGIYAYDVDGHFLWKVDPGRLDLGAYDVPTVEWGPASSPIIWNGLVIVQCDTQADSFVLALKADTGETVWKTERDEFPSWGTPTVATTPAGSILVTNASKFIRGYDPRTGKELWRLGGSSKITAPTPIFAEGLFVVASGRAPERPIFVVRPSARGDLTLPEGKTSSDAIAWSRTGRGPYMPTPLVYRQLLYVLANNGVFDAYNLRTGEEVYRQRLENIGSGFSASPVAADGKIYLSNEDGEVIVVAAGSTFRQIATNSMEELLMATPALSDGFMFIRTAASLVAIGTTVRSR